MDDGTKEFSQGQLSANLRRFLSSVLEVRDLPNRSPSKQKVTGKRGSVLLSAKNGLWHS